MQLSLDGRGLPNYGNCSIVLRSDFIFDRATVFEENTVLWLESQDIKIRRGFHEKIPRGFRATWQERGKLSVTKLARKLELTPPSQTHADILLSPGATHDMDEFVEAHIWGPLTPRAVENLTVTQKLQPSEEIIRDALQEKITPSADETNEEV